MFTARHELKIFGFKWLQNCIVEILTGMQTMLPWSLSGCHTDRPADVRFPSCPSVRPHTTHASLLLTANTPPGSLYQPSDWKEKGARPSRDCNGFESYYQLLKAVSVLIAGISILLRCYGASLSKS